MSDARNTSPILVQLNGPKGTGKTTFANGLAGMLEDAGVAASVYSIKSPLRAMLFVFAEDYTGQPVSRTEESYGTLKSMDFGGILGRDLQIAWGTGMRMKEESILSRICVDKINSQDDLQVAIIDDIGFDDEYWFHHPRFYTITIYMDSRDGVGRYEHHQRFENDSRICLRGYADFVNPLMDEVTQAVHNLLKMQSDLAGTTTTQTASPTQQLEAASVS